MARFRWTHLALLGAAAWMAFLTYQSSQRNPFEDLPGVTLDHGPVQGDVLSDLSHVLAFGLLALLLGWGLRTMTARPWAYMAAIAVTALFGIGDELHQRLTPGRESSLVDFGFDVLGTVTALALFSALEIASGPLARLLRRSPAQKAIPPDRRLAPNEAE